MPSSCATTSEAVSPSRSPSPGGGGGTAGPWQKARGLQVNGRSQSRLAGGHNLLIAWQASRAVAGPCGINLAFERVAVAHLENLIHACRFDDVGKARALMDTNTCRAQPVPGSGQRLPLQRSCAHQGPSSGLPTAQPSGPPVPPQPTVCFRQVERPPVVEARVAAAEVELKEETAAACGEQCEGVLNWPPLCCACHGGC
jgi:hypothetical protein